MASPLSRRGLADLLTFERGGAGTYFDRRGRYASAAVDVPRFAFDPLTLAPRGLLIEPTRQNRCKGNLDLAGSDWDAATYAVDVTTGQGDALDGTITLNRIAGSGGAGYHALRQTIATAAGQVETISALVKEDGARYVVLGDANDAVWHAVTFDFQTESFSGQTNAVGRLVDRLRDGVYRIACVFTRVDAGSLVVGVGPSPNANDGSFPNYEPAGESVLVSLPQVEQGAYATSIIETAEGEEETRNCDVVRLPRGPWLDVEEGGLVVELELLGPAAETLGTTAILQLVDGTGGGYVSLREGEDGVEGVDLVVRFDGDLVVDTASEAYSAAGDVERHAIRYGVDDFAWVKDGGAPKASTSAEMPVVDRLWLGARVDGSETAGMHLRRLRARPVKPTDAQLQAFTA